MTFASYVLSVAGRGSGAGWLGPDGRRRVPRRRGDHPARAACRV